MLSSKIKLVPVIFLLILFSGGGQRCEASHSMGADITYVCLGPNQYEITLSFYRDCSGIPADSFAFLDFSSSCFPSGNTILTLIPGTGQEITPLCPSQVSTCNGGLFTGVQEYIYRGVVTLPGPCSDWTFSYNLCCRNAAITNIDLPASTLIYVFATLNSTISPCNNSPTFANLPVPFVCQGQQYCYNHGATDVDGDSLAYSLITPFSNPGFTVTYDSSFSASNPLTSNPGITFNPITGDICMTPTNLEVTVMAVLVSEYRNGVLIGSVERDIQITVISCNNQVPTLTGINGGSSFSQSVCAGNQICFNIFSADADAPQNTTISWDFGIPGATFTTIPGSRQSGTFCWTPQQSQISQNPYCFTVSVTDDNCPILGSQIFSYCITVTGVTVNAGPDISVGCNANSTVTAVASGGSGIYTYQWNNGSTNASITAGPGTYIVTASQGGCSNKDTVQILAGSSTPTAAFSMIHTCASLTVQFTNQSTISSGTISSYSWNFGDGNSSTAISPAHTYANAGTYQIMLIASSAGGCLDTLIQTLNLSTDQPAANFTMTGACVSAQINFTDQSTSISTISSWNWDMGDGSTATIQSPAHTYQNAGNYNVKLKIINANGCEDSLIQLVTVFPLPIPNAGNAASICEGDSITLTGTGGGNYTWNPGGINSATVTVSPNQSTTYTLSVIDANGCSAIDDVLITVNSNPVLVLPSDQYICIGDSVSLNAISSGNVGYNWTPGNTTNAQLSVSPLSTTQYHVIATNTDGCTDEDSLQVIVNQLPVLSASSTDAQCFGSMTGSASAQIASGTAPFNYSWSPVGGNLSQASALPAGTYTISVTDSNGCSQIASTTILEPAEITLAMNSTPALCFGASNGTASVNVSGGIPGYNYLWSVPGATGLSISGITAGNYSVTITDNNACTKVASVIVDEPDQLALNTSTAGATCFGSSTGTATVAVVGGIPNYSYLWTPGNSTANNLTGLSTGTYTVQVTDANSCSTTSSVFISEPTEIQLSSSSTPAACSTIGNGTASVISTGGTGTYSYLWSPFGGTSSNASSLTPGSYTVQVTDLNNCTASTLVNVGSIGGPVITPTISTNVSCFGGNNGEASINISAGTPPYSVVWSPSGGTTTSAINLGAGSYTATVTDFNGCLTTQQFNISEPPLLSSSIAKTDVSCFGFSDGTVTVDALGGVQPYSYAWTPAVTTNRIALNVVAGLYTVIVTDANGCSATVSTNVPEPTALNLQISSSSLLCHGDSNATASVLVNGGTPAYSYLWFPGGSTSTGMQGLRSGNYTVTVTDANACTSNALTSIINPAPLNVNLDTDSIICIGQNAIVVANATGGTVPYNYLWNTGVTDSALFVSPIVSTSYSVDVLDSNGCGFRALPVTVLVHPPLSVTASTMHVICEGDAAQISASAAGGNGGPYLYSWNQGSFLGNTNSVSPVSDSTFIVTVTDNCGTPAVKDSVFIAVHPLPQVSFLPQNITGCAPVQAVFQNQSVAPIGSQYLWNLGDNTTSSEYQPIHVYQNPGVYDVGLTIVSPEGCVASLTIPQVVIVYGYPIADFTQSSSEITILNPGISFSDASEDAISWEWDFGDGTPVSYEPNPVHEYPDSGTYTIRLIVQNAGGCADTIYSTLRVEMEFTIYAPNAFSPNGDGVNDGFRALGIGFTEYSMWILDRWGKKIFHSIDSEKPWDGTFFENGNQCQADVYEWVLDVKDFKNKNHRLIGHVTLMR